MFCPQCGNAVDDGSKFCPKCGKQLAGAGAPAAQGTGANAPAGAPAAHSTATASGANAAPAGSPHASAAGHETPAPKSAKSKKPLIIGGIAAVAVIAVAIVAAVLLMHPAMYTGTIALAIPYQNTAFKLKLNSDGTAEFASVLMGDIYGSDPLNNPESVWFLGTYERVDTEENAGIYSFTPTSLGTSNLSLDAEDFPASKQDLEALTLQDDDLTYQDAQFIAQVLSTDVQLVIPDKADGIEGTWGIRLKGTDANLGEHVENLPKESYVDVSDDGTFEARFELDAATSVHYAGSWTEKNPNRYEFAPEEGYRQQKGGMMPGMKSSAYFPDAPFEITLVK